MPKAASGRQGVTLIGRIIRTDACVSEGAAWLAERDARFAGALALTGPLPLRLRPDGFGALLDAIVSQQVSTASAKAISARLAAAGIVDEASVLAAGEEGLRACGFSRQKIRYALALGAAAIDWERLRAAPDDIVIETLVALPGVGLWTAEIYAMLSLGRADVFAPGDLALQEAARVLFDLPERPGEKALRAMAEAWSPWRSVAARALWSYYRVLKSREGVL
jgi:DNA-3-methyladenine glycosylase II